jgi:hypothetical protein
MASPCGVWNYHDVSEANLAVLVAGEYSQGAVNVTTTKQPNGLYSVTATFPPCGAEADKPSTREFSAAAVAPQAAIATSTVGIDCAIDCASHAAAIAASAAKVVGRYYRWPTSKYPPLTHAEATSLSQAGLSILALWEWASTTIANFNFNDGVDQGSSAINQALKAHQPAGTPIYFAVDYDAPAPDIAGGIADYFRGIQHAIDSLKAGYLIGVYGSGRTCSWLLRHGAASHTWLANASKWAGADTFHDWNVLQGSSDLGIAGLTGGAHGDYDSDEVKASAGTFTVPA